MDQNNGISIYNSAAPQPSQAAQTNQAARPNQDGSYNRAANGEQQPINHNAPNNQQLNQDWQNLSNQLNQQQSQGQSGQQSGQDNGQPDQADDDNATDTLDQCKSSIARLGIPVSETGIPLVDDADKLLQQLANQGKIPSKCVPTQTASEIVCDGKMQNPHFSENAWRGGQRLVDVKVEVYCKEPVREVTISMVVKRDLSFATNWTHSNPPNPGKEKGPINFTAFFECGTGHWKVWTVMTGVTATGGLIAPINVGTTEADIPACESKRGG
ncbi:hypothetical protein [Mycobacteroides abscessus]|uniref:hypothetical protein n=1 Tax=Mycobacteroides abscessus TaxID=36809 RepID=UPI001F1B46AF|nr:hypothetical protein [Mycobacteroides abscessus]